jgi:hypothetical protein
MPHLPILKVDGRMCQIGSDVSNSTIELLALPNRLVDQSRGEQWGFNDHEKKRSIQMMWPMKALCTEERAATFESAPGDFGKDLPWVRLVLPAGSEKAAVYAFVKSTAAMPL